MKQTTFASLAYENKKRMTKRERFLDEMDEIVPWARFLKLIEPVYPKEGNGRRPMPLDRMLRIYCLQQWYALSDPAMEEALYDVESMRRFARIELQDDAVPDETTILNFRHLLERHQLTGKIFGSVARLLEQKGLLLHSGTIVDATIIPAPPSTKNERRERDPEMSSTKKGSSWHFGMKAHIGVDAESGLIHTVKVTTGRVADNVMLPELVHGREEALFGDKAYGADPQWHAMGRPKVLWGFMRKAPRGAPPSRATRRFNRDVASIRAKVEFPFRIIKRQFGYARTRYRGIAKNASQVMMLFALANLYQVRRYLRAT